MVNFDYDYIKNLYEDLMQKQVTFSDEMQEHIKNEFKKMIEQKKKYEEENVGNKTDGKGN